MFIATLSDSASLNSTEQYKPTTPQEPQRCKRAMQRYASRHLLAIEQQPVLFNKSEKGVFWNLDGRYKIWKFEILVKGWTEQYLSGSLKDFNACLQMNIAAFESIRFLAICIWKIVQNWLESKIPSSSFPDSRKQAHAVCP